MSNNSQVALYGDKLEKTCLQYVGFKDFSTPIEIEANSEYASTSFQPGVGFSLDFLDASHYLY